VLAVRIELSQAKKGSGILVYRAGHGRDIRFCFFIAEGVAMKPGSRRERRGFPQLPKFNNKFIFLFFFLTARPRFRATSSAMKRTGAFGAP
jgi:hypothetical protein